MVSCKKIIHVILLLDLNKYYKKEENNNFQCKLSRIYFCMEKNPHFRDLRYIILTLPYQLMYEYNSLGKQIIYFFPLLHRYSEGRSN